MTDEFSYICSNEEFSESRYENASGQFKARYGLFKASGGGGATSGSSREQIKSACNIGMAAFSEFIQAQESTSSGTALAGYIVECARVLAGGAQTRILGALTASDEDDRFIARVEYVPGDAGLTYKLTAIEGDPTQCTINMGESDAVQNVVLTGRATRVFTCTKDKGKSWIGGFQFEPEGDGQPIETSASVASRDVAAERAIEMETIAQRIDGRLRLLESTRVLAIGTVDPCLVDRTLLSTSPNQPLDDSIAPCFGDGGVDGGAAGFV